MERVKGCGRREEFCGESARERGCLGRSEIREVRDERRGTGRKGKERNAGKWKRTLTVKLKG